MMRNTILLTLFLALGSLAHAQNWPQWRGPSFNGATDATSTPAELSDKTLRWSVALNAGGAGTPVIWGDRVFVSGIEEKTFNLVGICLDRATGKQLWKQQLGTGFTRNQRNTFGSPSPITDGEKVFFHFGNGELAALSVDGKPVWQRNIAKDHGPLNYLFIHGSSPLLHKGKLYLNLIHRNVPYDRNIKDKVESCILAIDPATGKDLWKTARLTDARDEAMEAYGTPVPLDIAGRTEILTVGADYLTAHDADSGKELWRCGGWNPAHINHWRLVPSVVVANGLAIVCAPKGGPILAIKPGGFGDVTATHIAWKSNDATSDVCVPLSYRDNLYVLDGDRKTLTCLDPATGKVKWSGAIEPRSTVLRTSPTGADGKIYCMNEAGRAWILSADEFKILSTMELETTGLARASVAAIPGQVFFRTADRLYCFGK